MDFSVLSRYDDILADYFVDNLFLWYNTLRMNGDFVGTVVDKQQIVVRLREHIVEDSLNHLSMKNAADSFLSLPYFQDYTKDFQVKELQEFTQHMKRYLLMYKHNAGFEVGSTTRYTGKPEACIIATKAWNSGEQVTCCVGSIAALSEQDDLKLKKEGRDFSVMVSTRKKCSCLFLGPARFMNHDCDSNCEFILLGQNSITFRVIKDIKIGEEMTVFYADHYFGEDNSECLCCSCERLQQGHFSSQKDDDTAVEESDSEQIVQNENNGSRRSGRKRKEISYKDFYVPDQVKRARTASTELVSETNAKPMHEITNMDYVKEKDEILDLHSRTESQEEANSTANPAILPELKNDLCENKQNLDKHFNQYSYDQMPTPDSVEAVHINQPMTSEAYCSDQTLDSNTIDKNQQLNFEDVNMDESIASKIQLDSTQTNNNFCRLENGEKNSDEVFKNWLDDLSDVSDSEENTDTKKQLPLKSNLKKDLELNCCSDWKEFCMSRISEDPSLCGRCNRHYQIYGLQWPIRKVRRLPNRSKAKGAAKSKLPQATSPPLTPPTVKDERKPRIKGSNIKRKPGRKPTKKNSIPLANNINSGPVVINTLTSNLSIPTIQINNIPSQSRSEERSLALQLEGKPYITWRSKRVTNAGIQTRNIRLMELEERNDMLHDLRIRLHQLTHWRYHYQPSFPPPQQPIVDPRINNNPSSNHLLPHKQPFINSTAPLAPSPLPHEQQLIGTSINSVAPPAPSPLPHKQQFIGPSINNVAPLVPSPLPHEHQCIGPSHNNIAPTAPLPPPPEQQFIGQSINNIVSPAPSLLPAVAKETIPPAPLSLPLVPTEVQRDATSFSKSTECLPSHDVCAKDTQPNNLPKKGTKSRKPHVSSTTTSNDQVPPPPPVKGKSLQEKPKKFVKMRKISLKTKKIPLTKTNVDRKAEIEANFTLEEKNNMKLKSPVIDVENDFEDEHPIVNTTPILDNCACTSSSVDSSPKPVVNNGKVINEKANKQTKSRIKITLDQQKRTDNKQGAYFELPTGDFTKHFPSNQHVYIETARESRDSSHTSCTFDNNAQNKEKQPGNINFVGKEVNDLKRANDNDETKYDMPSPSYADTSCLVQSTVKTQPTESLNIPQAETTPKIVQSALLQSSQDIDTVDTINHDLDQTSLSHQHLNPATPTEIKKEDATNSSKNVVKCNNVITDLAHVIVKATDAIDDRLAHGIFFNASRNQPAYEAQAKFADKTLEFVNNDIDSQVDIVTKRSEEGLTSQASKVTNQDKEVESQADKGDNQASNLATSEVTMNEVNSKFTSHANNETPTEVESEEAISQPVAEVTKKITSQNDSESDNEVSRSIVNQVSDQVSTDTLDSIDKIPSSIVDEVPNDIVKEISNDILDEISSGIVDERHKSKGNATYNETNREIGNAIDFELAKEVGIQDINEMDYQAGNQNEAGVEPISEFDAEDISEIDDVEPISEIDIEAISEIDIVALSEIDLKINYESHFDTTSEPINEFEIDDINQDTLSRDNRKSDESKSAENPEPNHVSDLHCVIDSKLLVQEANVSDNELFSSQVSTVINDADSKLPEKPYFTTSVDSDVANREQFEQENSLQEDTPSPTFTEIMEYAVLPKKTSSTSPPVKEEMLVTPLYFTENGSIDDYQRLEKTSFNEELEEPSMTDTTALNSFDNTEDEQHSDTTESLDFKSIVDKSKPADNEPIETPSSSVDFVAIVNGPRSRETMSSMTDGSYFSSIVGSGLQDTYNQTTAPPTLREEQLTNYYLPYYPSGCSQPPYRSYDRDSILNYETLINSQSQPKKQLNTVDKNSEVVYQVKKEYIEKEYTQLLQQPYSTIQRSITQQNRIVEQESSEENYPQYPLPSFKDIVSQNHPRNYIYPPGSMYQSPATSENMDKPSLLGIARLLSQEKAESNSVQCQMAPIANLASSNEQQKMGRLSRYLRDDDNSRSSRNNESARQTIPQQAPMKLSNLLQAEEVQKEERKTRNRPKITKKKRAVNEIKVETQIKTMAQTTTVERPKAQAPMKLSNLLQAKEERKTRNTPKTSKKRKAVNETKAEAQTTTIERPKTRSTTAAIKMSSQRPKRKSAMTSPTKATTSMTSSRRLRPAIKKYAGSNMMDPVVPRDDTLPPMLFNKKT